MTLPHITNKQKEILLLLYRFRFINRKQIQSLLHHKSTKNINIWLKDLTDKKYINRIYNKTRQEMYNPARYYISTNGLKFLKSQSIIEKENIQKLAQEKRKSNSFINQCILIADNYLQLSQIYQNPPYQFTFYTQNDFDIDGVIRDLMPHFAYVIQKDDTFEHYACEIIKENTPRFAIRSRLNHYLDFFETDTDNSHIIFYCPTKKTYDYVLKYSSTLSEEREVPNIVRADLFNGL